MKKTVETRTIDITKYFISLPSLKYFLLAIVFLGFIFGVVINVHGYSGPELVYKGFLDGMLLLTLPAVLSIITVKLLMRKIPFRRIAATTFLGELIYAIAYSSAFFLIGVNYFYAELLVLVGAGVVFIVWYLIARLIFILKYRSFLFASLQLLFHLVFLVNTGIIYAEAQFFDSVAKFYLSSFVLLLGLYVFFMIINAPLKKSFGVSSTDAISFFVSQWLYSNKDLEKTFTELGEQAKTLVSVFSFKREDDNILFVVPYVHFGPFGNLGGSEFSYLISKELESKYNAKPFVFHGTVTHDLNPVSSKELKNIISACDACLSNATYSKAQVSLSFGSMDECHSELLAINDSAFISVNRAPHTTEDINFGVGLSMMYEAEKAFKNATVVDQHNSDKGQVTSFEPGSTVSFNYINAVRKNVEQRQLRKQGLAIGISRHQSNSELIGKAGIKVAVISSLPEYVMVVIDSNGIDPDFRKKIISSLEEVGRKYQKDWHVAVFTTDTHQINMVRGIMNPLKDEDSTLEEIKLCAAEAMFDVKPAMFYSNKVWFSINVFGPKNSIEFASTVNSVISIAKIIAPIMLIASIFAILLIFSKIGL